MKESHKHTEKHDFSEYEQEVNCAKKSQKWSICLRVESGVISAMTRQVKGCGSTLRGSGEASGKMIAIWRSYIDFKGGRQANLWEKPFQAESIACAFCLRRPEHGQEIVRDKDGGVERAGESAQGLETLFRNLDIILQAVGC